MRKLLLLIALIALPATADWPGWKIKAETSRFESHLGRNALFLQKGEAWLDSARFTDGVIEFDVAAPAAPGFHGLAFRAADHENYEEVYLRSHLSDQPDATQYTPVFNGIWGWQIYAGPRYSLPCTIAADHWVHVRVVARGRRLELHVDGQVLVFPEMVRTPAAGGIGINSSAGPAWFANVVVKPDEATTNAGGDGAPAAALPEGLVTHWRVSNAFAESAIDPHDRSLRWDTLDAGPNGIVNLAMLRRRTDTTNTVFAAVTLHAEKRGVERVRFGFSDRVIVFLNGKRMYRGDDTFQTRDSRFLGTVGLFDELDLPLEAGDNELWFAVSETFGGWAVMLQRETKRPGVSGASR
jgi:hypothetical protein